MGFVGGNNQLLVTLPQTPNTKEFPKANQMLSSGVFLKKAGNLCPHLFWLCETSFSEETIRAVESVWSSGIILNTSLLFVCVLYCSTLLQPHLWRKMSNWSFNCLFLIAVYAFRHFPLTILTIISCAIINNVNNIR